MAKYEAPLRDMQFVLHEVLGVEAGFSPLPGQDETSAELINAVLEEAAKLCEEVLQPLNRTGDEHGCVYENGVVRTPPGFKEAYQAFSEGGWASLACETEYGGQGLPKTINLFVDEMVASANMSFGLYFILTFGAYLAISEYADDDLKNTYLPHLAKGDWSGTMCLTESHSGTDLGLTRTKAVPAPDGSYQITGTKIFITGGEQDLSDNIIHLVLARTPDAPPGVKGISLFLVPKYLVKDDGSVGARNGVFCGSIEEKMGIHGAPTCVINFEEATGFLVGDLNRGVRSMFTMMNHERLVVGVQGLALAETAYQSAADYAKERLQSRSLSGVKNPDQSADPIIVHPDVRRMLLTTRAYNEGARAFLGWMGIQIDYSHHHPDPEVREGADDLVALLTPVIKGFFTDTGSEACNLCLQVFGGHGYIAENGMEQLVRDVRISQLYEGTNGIQALDLVGRKLPMKDGAVVGGYFATIQSLIDEHRGNPELSEFSGPLESALSGLREVTDWVIRQAGENPEEAGAASADYMRYMGLVSLGFMWLQMVKVALDSPVEGDTKFYASKLSTARFFMQRLLPQTSSLGAIIQAGSSSLMELEAEAF